MAARSWARGAEDKRRRAKGRAPPADIIGVSSSQISCVSLLLLLAWPRSTRDPMAAGGIGSPVPQYQALNPDPTAAATPWVGTPAQT